MRVRISLGARTSMCGGELRKARQDGNVAAVFQESRYAWRFTYAFLAQLVEHFSRKEEVTGSNPVAGSKKYIKTKLHSKRHGLFLSPRR